jgi:hypothetical protein
MNRYKAEASGAVLDTKTGLREWCNSMREAIEVARKKNTVIHRPLPPGAIIDFCGEQATVICDQGGSTISVLADGFRQNWYWAFEGTACTVIAMPETASV